ncbi:MAG: hypothetical protein KIT87_25285 [Anaerolineae bacterium]|nr:hypothetical protein [Anaerolineae bacterium]
MNARRMMTLVMALVLSSIVVTGLASTDGGVGTDANPEGVIRVCGLLGTKCPDLTWGDIQWIGPNPTYPSLHQYFVNFEIRNVGDANAGYFMVDMYEWRQGPQGGLGDFLGQFYVPSLLKGQSAWRGTTVENRPCVAIQLDVSNSIREHNEQNNFFVRCSPGQ